MSQNIQITELLEYTDARGFNFQTPGDTLASFGSMAHLHVSSVKSGAVRGNHYHSRRQECLLVLPGVKWSLYWGESASSASQHRDFAGDKAVLVLIFPGAPHAIRNDGASDLSLVSISTETYDPAETVAHKLI